MWGAPAESEKVSGTYLSRAMGESLATDKTILIERVFDAPREAVFRACYILKGLGAEFVDVDLSGLNDACDHWLTICAGALDQPTGLRTTAAWWMAEHADYHTPEPGIEEIAYDG